MTTRIRERLGGVARRLAPWSQELEWGAIGLVGAVAFVLGFIGVHSALSARGEPSGFWAVLYGNLQLFALEPGPVEGDVPWQLDVARIAVPAVTVLAVVKGATLLLRDDLILLRARFAGDHVIVCGLGRRGLRLTRSLLDRGNRVVVIEADADNDRLRAAQRGGAGVVIGDATDPETLRRAGVGRASWLISVCREDGTNAAVAAAARELAAGRRRGHSLGCVIHIFDRALCELLRGRQIAASETIPFRLDVFNLFEDGARAMLLDHPVGAGEGPAPHVIVVGLGWLGDRLVVEIARSWREQGGLDRDGRLSITLVDPRAKERMRSVVLRDPWIEQVAALHPATIAVGSPEFDSGEFLEDGWRPWRPRRLPRGDAVLAYVCLDDATLALDAALTLGKHAGERARVVVRTETEEGLGSLLASPSDGGAPGIVTFPLLDRVCDAASVIGFTFTERLAREMHEDYREHGPHDPADPSMRPWEELEDELRESNRDAARDVGRKLSVVGCEPRLRRGQEPPQFRFTHPEVELFARMEHERWIADRRRNGWKLGPRDPGARTSPYLIPFEQLPPDVQDYDRDAVRDLPRILARVGYGIARTPVAEGPSRPR